MGQLVLAQQYWGFFWLKLFAVMVLGCSADTAAQNQRLLIGAPLVLWQRCGLLSESDSWTDGAKEWTFGWT